MGEVTQGWDDDDWSAPACGVWNATEVAGHLVTVACWYHQWLDRAETGQASPPFPAKELADHTASALAGLEPASGPERVEAFTHDALAYAGRLPAGWDLPYGYPFGTVTAGLHAGVATVEWHIHAWDLARSAGADHRPAEPEAVAGAAIECVVAATGGVRGALIGRIAPLAFRRDPWVALLKRSGRRP